MSAYRRGLRTTSRVAPEPVRRGLDRVAAYRSGLADAMAGAGYHYRRGYSVDTPQKPTERAANWAMSAVHTGLLVFGLASIARL